MVCLVRPSKAAFPEFHGEDTELRWALEQVKVSRLIDGYVWTVGNAVLVIQLYPAPMDWREEDHPAEFPKHIASVGPVRAQHLRDPSLIGRVESILRKSDIILLLREQDGKSCILNELHGQRIYEQNGHMQDSTAVRYDSITYQQVLERQLKVMDASAISLCMENNLPIVVFNMRQPGNIMRVVLGETGVGTRVWCG